MRVWDAPELQTRAGGMHRSCTHAHELQACIGLQACTRAARTHARRPRGGRTVTCQVAVVWRSRDSLSLPARTAGGAGPPTRRPRQRAGPPSRPQRQGAGTAPRAPGKTPRREPRRRSRGPSGRVGPTNGRARARCRAAVASQLPLRPARRDKAPSRHVASVLGPPLPGGHSAQPRPYLRCASRLQQPRELVGKGLAHGVVSGIPNVRRQLAQRRARRVSLLCVFGHDPRTAFAPRPIKDLQRRRCVEAERVGLDGNEVEVNLA